MSNAEQEDIFRRWLDQHLGLLLKVIRACAVNQQDRDDLFQDVLMNLWSSIPNFRGDAKETTWIYRVAFNTAQVWQRGEQRRRQKHQAFMAFAATTRPELTAENSVPVTGITHPKSELIERLHAAIGQLPKVDSALAIMHLDGVSYKEMADVVGISESHVGVKLNRIRKYLADQLRGDTDGI
jgi:RNA polymerase sigma-70 factor (ECF subfamily)